MQNPKTPQRVRLLAGVEHNVINFTKGEPYIKCRKTPEELSFSSFFYRLGSSGAWEEKAGNEQLAREIRGWPLNKNSDIDFYVSPGTEGIEFEKLSSLEEAKSWFAWKSPESNKWTFCIRQGSQAGKEGLAAMTADLPVATDGWLSIKQHTDPNKYVIMGATPEGDKRRHYWITTGKKEKLLMKILCSSLQLKSRVSVAEQTDNYSQSFGDFHTIRRIIRTMGGRGTTRWLDSRRGGWRCTK